MNRTKIIKKSDLETLIAQGCTQVQIAKRLGVGRSTVIKNLRKYGLETSSTVEVHIC